MKCTDCGHENREGELLCGNCGADLYDLLLEKVATKQIERRYTRDLRIDEPASSRPILLYIGQEDTPIVIERSDNQIIGRGDTEQNLIVDIDLSIFDGHGYGVSRQHARIDAGSHPPKIVDLKSSNGTFINGSKIPPNQSVELRSGDALKLGRLETRVYYK